MIRVLVMVAGVVAMIPVSLALAAEGTGGAVRSRVIDFEDELVEGINKKPLDSLSQVSERERARRRRHLYRKRVGFRDEVLRTVKELRYR